MDTGSSGLSMIYHNTPKSMHLSTLIRELLFPLDRSTASEYMGHLHHTSSSKSSRLLPKRGQKSLRAKDSGSSINARAAAHKNSKRLWQCAQGLCKSQQTMSQDGERMWAQSLTSQWVIDKWLSWERERHFCLHVQSLTNGHCSSEKQKLGLQGKEGGSGRKWRRKE